MKKTYQTPITKIVKVQTMQMIALSNPHMYGKSATGDAMSRRGTWDDDDFDE